MHQLSWDQRRASAETVHARDLLDPAVEPTTILLAEDDAAVRSLLARVLRSRGYTVTEAANGAEALAIAEGLPAPFQLLLTDVMMPELNGRDLATRLLAGGRVQRVIFITGYADLALEAGERAVLMYKPFTLRELTRVVEASLARASAV